MQKKFFVIFFAIVAGIGIWLGGKHFSGIRLVTDPSSGKTFFCKRVEVVFFQPGNTDLIASAFTRVNGRPITGDPQLNAYLLELPGPCDTRTVIEAIKLLERTPGVKSAGPAYPRNPL